MAMRYGLLNRLRIEFRTEPADRLANILADLAVGNPEHRLETLDPLRAKMGKETTLRILIHIVPNLSSAANM